MKSLFYEETIMVTPTKDGQWAVCIGAKEFKYYSSARIALEAGIMHLRESFREWDL